jgi:Small-conductance mechanosensitive channel
VTDLYSLPGLRSLPFRSGLIHLTELVLLALLFVVLRAALRRIVRKTADAIIAREEAAGKLGRAQRVRTLASLLLSIATYTLAFIVLLSALGTLGVNVLGLLGTAGVAGLAVGFGAQKLVKDVISGFFLLLEDQYAVGDYVSIGAVTGVVEELGMRITRVRDDDGRLFILSNGDITQVCNHSRGPVAGSFEVAIGASADISAARKALDAALKEVSEEMKLPEPAHVAGITAADAAKTTLRITYRVAVSAGQARPMEIALHLRETARRALLDAEVPLA